MRSILGRFRAYLFAGRVEVSNQVIPVLLLLGASEHHLGAGDVLLGVGQVNIQGVVPPCDSLLNVSLGVGEPGSLSGLSPEHAVEVGSLLVLASSLDGVALGTGLGEDLFTVIGAHYCSLVEVNQAIL